MPLTDELPAPNFTQTLKVVSPGHFIDTANPENGKATVVTDSLSAFHFWHFCLGNNIVKIIK